MVVLKHKTNAVTTQIGQMRIIHGRGLYAIDT